MAFYQDFQYLNSITLWRYHARLLFNFAKFFFIKKEAVGETPIFFYIFRFLAVLTMFQVLHTPSSFYKSASN